MAVRVPSPADAPRMTAKQLLRRIRQDGGKVYRMREWCVFAITENRELAEWLIGLGAKSYLPRGMEPSESTPPGSYRNARDGAPRWDVYIHHIPVRGEQSVWEAARDSDADLHLVRDADKRGFYE